MEGKDEIAVQSASGINGGFAAVVKKPPSGRLAGDFDDGGNTFKIQRKSRSCVAL